jgi:hypothetical protein
MTFQSHQSLIPGWWHAQHLDAVVGVGELAKVIPFQRPRLGALGCDQQVMRVQLSQHLLLHLWVLGDHKSAAQGTPRPKCCCAKGVGLQLQCVLSSVETTSLREVCSSYTRGAAKMHRDITACSTGRIVKIKVG